MNILNVPSYFNFLESLLNFAIQKSTDKLSLSKITILLPSRRSCNELKRLFLENSNNDAIILPNIKAIGDIDYDDLMIRKYSGKDLEKFDNISSNTSRVRYKILLIKELLKWAKLSDKNLFKDITMEQATNLSLELEKFLNEVNKNSLSLDNLENIVDDEYSKHWQEILSFLEIFGKKWNKFTLDNNVISMNDFRTKMILFNSEYFKNNKPNNAIIIAGVSCNVKNTCELIKNIIQHDNCYYIFKGLNKDMSDEEWNSINVFHPQYSFKNLLENCICIDRNKVMNFQLENNSIVVNKNIEKIISYSMLPYDQTYKWQNKLNIKESDFSNISKIECKDIFEELNIISYIIKYRTETTNETIAVIVSNDDFANQLEIELRGFSLNVNNAFGNKISRTEISKFLFLILDVIKSDFETISLLSLIKNRFTLFGYDRDKLDEITLILEDNILRGFGNLGLNGISKRIEECKNEELKEFFKVIIEELKDLVDFKKNLKNPNLTFQNILKIHLQIAENIASNDKIKGFDIFWNNEKDGFELLNFFNEIIKESEDYGEVKTLEEYSNLLNYLIAENSYSDKYSIHPMINIISPQESRLINYDLIIVSNLNEGEFPPHISTDPWMSKSMRKYFGLNEKEELIGNYAYDFTQYLANKEVILTRSLKKDGIPTTKSKYLMRLETFLKCQNDLKIKENNIWKNVYKKYNEIKNFITIKRPKPTPPLEKRPTELYATKIEKLINNPYDIYAEKILNIKKKDEFYENKVFAFFGIAVHEALEKYIKNYEKLNKNKLYEELINFGKKSFDNYFTNETSKELFFIRFSNISRWFVDEDQKIRENGYKVCAESIEKLYFEDLNFTVAAKIDRIEESETNSLNIIDYKTGIAPSQKDVISGKKPQLTIEAIILENKNKKVEKLAYWTIKGKNNENISEIKFDINELVEKGEIGLKKLIAYFKVYENSYIATSFDLNKIQYLSDYKHLSRVEEWGYI